MIFIRTNSPDEYAYTLWSSSGVHAIDVDHEGKASIPADEDERYYCIDRNGEPCNLTNAIVDLDRLKRPEVKADNGESSWERMYRELANLPSCNDCGATKYCVWKVKPGEVVRINCPLWEAKK